MIDERKLLEKLINLEFYRPSEPDSFRPNEAYVNFRDMMGCVIDCIEPDKKVDFLNISCEDKPMPKDCMYLYPIHDKNSTAKE